MNTETTETVTTTNTALTPSNVPVATPEEVTKKVEVTEDKALSKGSSIFNSRNVIGALIVALIIAWAAFTYRTDAHSKTTAIDTKATPVLVAPADLGTTKPADLAVVPDMAPAAVQSKVETKTDTTTVYGPVQSVQPAPVKDAAPVKVVKRKKVVKTTTVTAPPQVQANPELPASEQPAASPVQQQQQ